MNKLLSIIIVLVSLFSTAQAQDRRRAELAEQEALRKAQQELKFYQGELEKVRVNRWQDKRNTVAKKEAFQEVWEELRRDVDKLSLEKSQKDETLMRLQGQVENRGKEVEELALRRREFGIQIVEKLSEFEREVRSGFPEMRDELREQAATIKTFVEKMEYRPSPQLFQNIFYQHNRLLDLGETRELERTRFPIMGLANRKPGMPENAGTQMVAGYTIRLGTVYKNFISTETNDVAILARSGKLNEQAWTWIEDLQPGVRENLRAAVQPIAKGETNVPVLIPVDVQLRKATGAGFVAGEGVSWYKALFEEMKGAGFAIYLLAVILGIGLLVTGEKLYIFFMKGRHGKRFARKVMEDIAAGREEKALSRCRKAKGSVPLVMGAILKNRRKGRGSSEDSAYEVMLAESVTLERRISTVNILAAAAPLVGLLGTVSGMVNLFSAITMHGTNDPKVMAAGIGEALLSTKWGLLVAIPMLLLYNWMSNKAGSIVSDMEKYSAQTINAVFGPEDPDDEAGQDDAVAAEKSVEDGDDSAPTVAPSHV